MKKRLIAVLVSVGLGFAAQADEINLVTAQNINEHWGQALNGSSTAFWSDGNAPSGGNNYHAGNVVGGAIRTPAASSSSFAGDSLTLHAGALLLGKTNNPAFIHTVNDLRLNGGAVTHGQDDRIWTLAGNITVLTNSAFSLFGKNARPMQIDATLAGSAGLTVTMGDDDTFNLRSTMNAYTGDWTIRYQAATNPADDGVPVPVFTASGLGSLGGGNISITDNVIFDADYDIFNATAGLTLDGSLVLDQHHTFASAVIGGTPLSSGTHSFAELNALYDANFEDGGAGSITVIPEPSALGLLALAGMILGLSRKK